MAGAGFKDFQAGAKLTADQVDTYLMQQSVMRFASSAARSSAIGTAVAEGMVSYLDDNNSIEVYNGSSWVGLESTLNDGTAGYTALSNGTAGITYQPVSHNYIINGAFDIWQRGTTLTGGSTPYLADRWSQGLSSTSTITYSRQAFTPGDIEAIGHGDAQYYARLVTDTRNSSSYTQIVQRVEDVRTLAGQTVTLSFWARATGSFSALAYLAQRFGSGGSSSVFYTESFTMTTNWQRYSFSIDLGSMSGKTIGTGGDTSLEATVRQFLSSDGDSFDIWGVQLEAGSVATPFKRHAPSLQGELAACQRYFERQTIPNFNRLTVGQAVSTTVVHAVLDYSEKRSTPSISSTGTYLVTNAAGSTLTGTSILFDNIRTTQSRLGIGVAIGLVAGNASIVNGGSTAFTIDISSEL